MIKLLAVPALLVQLQKGLEWSLAIAWRTFVPSELECPRRWGMVKPTFAKLAPGQSSPRAGSFPVLHASSGGTLRKYSR